MHWFIAVLSSIMHNYAIAFLFVLMFYIPSNDFSVISEQFPVLLGQTSTKQRIKCFDQGYMVKDTT